MHRPLPCATRTRFLMLLIWVFAFCGCGEGRGKQEELDSAQRAVETALGAWKQGAKPDSLLAAPQSIEFFDEDWNKSVSLVEYTVHQTYFETDGTPRCAVDLTLKAGDQPPAQVRVTYEMANKNNRLVIARDPMS